MNDNTKYKKSNHNGIISFWKFMFAIMIVIYHVKLGTNYDKAILKCGYLGVEFFFIISGYLMARTALSKKEDCSNIGIETFEYLIKKIKTFLPFMMVPFFITLFIRRYSIGDMLNSVWNLFFLETSGIRTILVMSHTWYISAMLISMLILYPLIRKYKKNFTYLLAPIIVIFIGGWFSYTYGMLNKAEYTGIIASHLLRGFFELTLGTILYEVSTKMMKVNFNNIGKTFLTLVEISGFVSVFVIANIAESKYDFIALALMSISVIIAFSGKTIFYNLANNKLFYYLERLSLPIYINHNTIIWIIRKKLGFGYWETLTTSIFLTIIFSIIIMHIIEKMYGKPTKVARKLFISEK